MSLVNHKYHVTFTETTETYPSVDREINFTDNASAHDDKDKIYMYPGSEVSWDIDTPRKILDVSEAIPNIAPNGRAVKYMLIESDYPIYLWFDDDPTANPITATPLKLNGMMMWQSPAGGSIQKIWAVNPSRTTDPEPKTVSIKLYYTLVDLP